MNVVVEIQQLQATVQKVFHKGKTRSYALAYADEIGGFTFSLHQQVWKESKYPIAGDTIVASNFKQSRRGVRAECARNLTIHEIAQFNR